MQLAHWNEKCILSRTEKKCMCWERVRAITCVSESEQDGETMVLETFFLPVQKYNPVSDYNRISWYVNNSTNLNMFSTQNALWKWTMTDKHWAINRLGGRKGLQGYSLSLFNVFVRGVRVQLWKDSHHCLLILSHLNFTWMCVWKARWGMSTTLESRIKIMMKSYRKTPDFVFADFQWFNFLPWCSYAVYSRVCQYTGTSLLGGVTTQAEKHTSDHTKGGQR